MKVQEIDTSSEVMKKKLKKRKKKIKRILFFIKLILITGVLSTGIIFLALSPVFNISAIVVSGCSHYNEKEIADATDIIKGVNGFKAIGSNVLDILTLRYGKAEDKITANFPYVKRVVVRFAIPSKVKVKIVEREPIGYVRYMGSYLLIDNDGYVLENLKAVNNTKLPEYKGLKFKSFKVGQALKMENKVSFQKAMEMYKYIEDNDKNEEFNLITHVNMVDAADSESISIQLDSRVTVNLGTLENLSYKLNFLKKIYRENLKPEDRGYLDMTIDNPSFRPEK